jgi:cell division protein FtsW
METFNDVKINRKTGRDPILISCVLLLTGLGIVTLWSASSAYAQKFFDNGMYFFIRQLIFAAF